jgi:hypothetical protein
VQVAPSTRQPPNREIEVVNIARQTGRIDRASGSSADDSERIESASRKNPRDGA